MKHFQTDRNRAFAPIAKVRSARFATVTMNFKTGMPAPATWNVWLTSHNMMLPLWSQAQPVADPPVTLTKTYGLAKSGEVGILSTLATPDQGITCSTWQVVNTAP